MKYIIVGTDELSRQAVDFFGKENIECFFDSNYAEEEIESIPVLKLEDDLLNKTSTCKTVLTWNDVKNVVSSVKTLYRLKIDFSLFSEATMETIEKEAMEYDCMNNREVFSYNPERKKFFARDRVSQAGSINHYFWQDLWAAKHIFENKPRVHYDIGSRVDGFISNLLSFGQKVNLIDVRPLSIPIPGVEFTQSDAKYLENITDNSIYSLSALCSLEHFGLGRYGDTIDPEACFKCFESIQRKVVKGGSIYISVPIGIEGVEFNAHRIFCPSTIIEEFSMCELKEYSIDYGTHIEYNADFDVLNDAKNYEFGLFYFIKTI